MYLLFVPDFQVPHQNLSLQVTLVDPKSNPNAMITTDIKKIIYAIHVTFSDDLYYIPVDLSFQVGPFPQACPVLQ